MIAPPHPWTALLALGARTSTVDAAVRSTSLGDLWASTSRADVLLDVARVAGVELGELFAVADAVCEGPILAGARTWARAGLAAIERSEAFPARYAFARVLDALELVSTDLAGRVRERLDGAAIGDALARAVAALPAVAAPTREDDLARIVGSHRAPLPAPERDVEADRARSAVDRFLKRSRSVIGGTRP